jgi:2-oxoisovalerate dehydrogenase E1 component alpha subunit
VSTVSEPARVPVAAHEDSEHSTQPHKLLALYHTMVLARALERRMWLLNRPEPIARQIRVAGFEGVQCAAAAVLQPEKDWIVPYHRDLALCLAMGLTPLDVMAGFLGRASDPGSGGRQAPGSYGLRKTRIVSTSALLATHVLHAAGIAYASKLQGHDEVVLACIGEDATATGDWHEGLNFAAVHRLPLVCLVEDNSSQVAAALVPRASDDLLARCATGYGIVGCTVDGTDFPASFAVLGRAVEHARSGRGPTLVHARVADLTSMSPLGGYRPQEELEALAQQDPIERMRRHLIHSLVLDTVTDEQIQLDCIDAVEAAVQDALAARSPAPEQALQNVWTGVAR